MLYPVPVDGLYPVLWGSYAERVVGGMTGSAAAVVDDPWETAARGVSVCARPAPEPPWLVVFVVIFPVLLSTADPHSNLRVRHVLHGPRVDISRRGGPCAFCARWFRSLSTRGFSAWRSCCDEYIYKS